MRLLWRECTRAIAPLLATILATLALTACSARTPDTTTFTGVASKVHDGDSIHLLPAAGERVIIRLAGIDAPELKQPFGIQARDHLRALILAKPVRANCHKTDRYDRHLCVVYRDERDINLQMIDAGYAWHYKKYQGEQTRAQRRQYSAAQSGAERQRRGLWRADTPVPPWNYRKNS